MELTAEDVLLRFDALETERRTFESQLQEVKDLVRPDTTDFMRQTWPGQRLTEKIFDSTAPLALSEMASGLHSFMTSPSDRWFNLAAIRKSLMDDDDCLMWLEMVSDIIYFYYGIAEANFNTTLHESYSDLGAFGSSVIYQEWDYASMQLRFKSFALAHCYFEEDHNGLVDTVFRKVRYTAKQAIDHFGDKCPKDVLKAYEEKKRDRFTFVHGVFPRKERDSSKSDSANKKFASVWVFREKKEMVMESGYDSLPYHVSRWVKLPEETYGRAPGVDCLPDIKMINEMSKIIIKAGQKIIDPPLMVPDDGFMVPLRTSPGGLNYYTPQTNGQHGVYPLETKGRVDIGFEMIQKRVDVIQKAFFTDGFRLGKMDKVMTAYETQDRRDEQMRLMSPILGRLAAEMLQPLLRRSYSLLNKAGLLPPCPRKLRGQKLEIEYISPAARAQKSGKAGALSQWIQDLTQVAQEDPQVFDAIDLDKYAQITARIRDVTRLVLRSPEDIAQVRAQRQKQQQMQQLEQASNAGVNGSQAMLNLSKSAAINSGQLSGMAK